MSTGTSTRSPVTVSRISNGVPVTGARTWRPRPPTGAQIATGKCWAGDKQINNLPAGNYTLDFHGTKEALGTFSSGVLGLQ